MFNSRKTKKRRRRRRRPQKGQRSSSKGKSKSKGNQQQMMASQDMQTFAEMLLDNDAVENEAPEFLEDFWGFNNRDARLTFLDEKEKRMLLRAYDDTILSQLMTQLPSDFTGEQESQLTQGRAYLRILLNRAQGRGRMNERTMLSTQIQQNRNDDLRRPPQGGVLSKVKQAVGMGNGGRR